MTISIAPDRPADLLDVPADPTADGADTVIELARRLPPDLLTDLDDVVAAIEALGVTDRTARQRFGMPSVFSLGDAVLTHLRHGHAALRPRHGVRRAPARRRYLLPALARCALYLGPLSAAVVAGGLLGQVAWPVPVAALTLGWAAAQALAALAGSVARRTGTRDDRRAAARLVGAGFGATAALWCALIWVAPPALVGPHRLLAVGLGLGALACLSTVTAALVTRTEVAVVRWGLPLWLLAAVSIADSGSGQVPATALLPAAILLPLLRAFRPMVGGRVPKLARVPATDLRTTGCYLVIGAAQAGCVALLWHAGAAGTPPPAMLPLLAAVPMLEALVGWHTQQVDAGLDAVDSGPRYARHLRSVTVVAVAGLLPPLATGVALTIAAYRLPLELTDLAGVREVVLALAGGTLLGGVLAATLLLAARGRAAAAAVLAAAPLVLTGVVCALPGSWLPDLWLPAYWLVGPGGAPDPLPVAVTLLALTHLLGLPAVAATALDHRRTS